VARVETASLQLAAIMAKFPEEIKKLVLKLPPPEAMVALPLPTILKFLPTGSVKMSLASVVRQAPPGTFAALNPGDKRLVEVPLAEIFKRVSPAILKKREDQRVTDLAAEGFDLFGDEENPHALAPRVAEEPPPAVFAPRALQKPAAPIVPENPKTNGPKTAKPKAVPAAAESPAAPKAPVADDQPPLVMPIKELASAWPEPIKAEVHALNGTTVALPAGQVSAGLAKGKVAFAWGQLRGWMTPPPSTPTTADEATELQLPLRIIAPAFMKHSKAGQARKAASTPDDSIPALFGPAAGTAPPPPAAPAEAAPAVAETPPVVTTPEPAPPAPVAETGLKLEAAPAHAEPPTPAPAAKKSKAKRPAEEPAPTATPAPTDEIATPAGTESTTPAEAAPAELAPAAEAPTPVAAVPAAAPAEPQTVGEFFNQPGKESWTPGEIVAALGDLPAVAGSVVALQEGLVIAHRMPEPFKGEVFAAFLPQIFARLNQYSSEMKLGAVNELTITADGAPCHLFRRGQVFFAVLGKADTAVSTAALRKCADALASQ
jgi:predicted regulator of Ras-like GTPase activity (Roadblock/LC7/MglB family)